MSIKKIKMKSNHFHFPDLFKRLKSVVVSANIKMLYVGTESVIPNKEVYRVSPNPIHKHKNYIDILLYSRN